MTHFWLGVHLPHWLAQTDVPLFVSRRRLMDRRTFPRALGIWALDSGGFTELSMYHHWTTSAEEYITDVRRFRDEIGGMAWAAQQDWMCEPFMLERTGLSLMEHQRRTVENFVTLRSLAPDVPWLPVLQGWRTDDYLRCAERFQQEGIDLEHEPLVGVGSVCRRQHTNEAAGLFRRLAASGFRLHGFGVKIRGLLASLGDLASSDSMAWSFEARYNEALPGHAHMNCANCLEYALRWRQRVIERLEYPPAHQVALAI